MLLTPVGVVKSNMQKLRELRERAKLSQRGLAMKVGVSYSTIYLLESGNHNPQRLILQTVLALCEFFPTLTLRDFGYTGPIRFVMGRRPRKRSA